MALPDLIEVMPLTGRVEARVTVPGSKSITNRALVLAALAHGESVLKGALWSEDTQVMVACLQDLGYLINVSPDPRESANRTIAVYGRGNRIPRGGTADCPLDLFVGNAGTAARFLAALVCLGDGFYRLHGVDRMHERPQASLFKALRQLGYQVASPSDRLPAVIHGTGPQSAEAEVSILDSSQFASALILSSRTGGWRIAVRGEDEDQSPYVRMTTSLVEQFPVDGGVFQVEPDASSGSYLWGAGFLGALDGAGGAVEVLHWPSSGWQMDQAFPAYLKFPEIISRRTDLGDSIMTAIVLAPLTGRTVVFADLGRLRVQECERVAALKTELGKCGARIREEGDTLTIDPAKASLHGAEIDTYNDHRMAMCFAMLGLKVPGMQIRNPACVKKTFPNFFAKLAQAAPDGLGAEIRDGDTGRPLAGEDLLAEDDGE